MSTETPKTARDYAKEMFAEAGHCNCDLDNWEPERSTGHSWVCRIHTAALAKVDADTRAARRAMHLGDHP